MQDYIHSFNVLRFNVVNYALATLTEQALQVNSKLFDLDSHDNSECFGTFKVFFSQSNIIHYFRQIFFTTLY